MGFDLVIHYHDALFNIIAMQQRDQAVIEVTDDVRRQTAKWHDRSDGRPMAAEATKPHENAANEHDSCASANVADVKSKRNRRYGNAVCGKQGHKQWDCPQCQQGKAGKEKRPWPEPRPDPHAAAPVHKRSRSAYLVLGGQQRVDQRNCRAHNAQNYPWSDSDTRRGGEAAQRVGYGTTGRAMGIEHGVAEENASDPLPCHDWA